MMRRLLARLLGKRCFCGTRSRDLARHQLDAHTDAELMQATEMGLR